MAAPHVQLVGPVVVQEVDMWSQGCILHILLSGKVPFSNFNSAVQDRKVLEGAWDTSSKVRAAGSTCPHSRLAKLCRPHACLAPSKRRLFHPCLL